MADRGLVSSIPYVGSALTYDSSNGIRPACRLSNLVSDTTLSPVPVVEATEESETDTQIETEKNVESDRNENNESDLASNALNNESGNNAAGRSEGSLLIVGICLFSAIALCAIIFLLKKIKK